MEFSVPPERPLPEDVTAILRHVAAARERGIEYSVGGAVARDLLLFHVFGQRTTRATRDVDAMVFVEDWTAFDDPKARLVAAAPFIADPRNAHRLLYGAKEVPLDLVPFGGVEDPAGTVAWPPEREVIMNVTAFREAVRTSIVVVAPGLTVPVVSLAALSLLKLTAWLDRWRPSTRSGLVIWSARPGAAAIEPPMAWPTSRPVRRSLAANRVGQIPAHRRGAAVEADGGEEKLLSVEGAAVYRAHRRRTLSLISCGEGGFSPRPRVCSASWMRASSSSSRSLRRRVRNRSRNRAQT